MSEKGIVATGPAPVFIDQVIEALKERDEFMTLDLAAELIENMNKIVTILDGLSDVGWLHTRRLNSLDRKVKDLGKS